MEKKRLKCQTCKKWFEPIRFDQKCCSRECRAKQPRTTYAPYDAEANKRARIAARLAMIKTLDKTIAKPLFVESSPIPVDMDEVPEFKAALQEAGAE